MRAVFAVATGLMVGLSLLAWFTRPSTVSAGRTTLTWVSDENPLRKEQAALVGRLEPDLHVLLDPGNRGLDKVIVQSLGGVGPDVFDAFDGYQLAAYVRSGVALDMTSELQARGIDVRRDVFPGALGTAVYDGRVYGVPTNIAADGIWFHKDLFDQEGVPYPAGPMRWPEFVELAKKMTRRRADGKVERYGFLFPWWNWRHLFLGFGARVFSKDGTRCVVDEPGAVAAVQLMVDLVYTHRVSPTPAEEASMATQGGFGSGDITFFAAKRGAMALGGRWWLANLRNETGLRLGVSESPFATVREFRGYGRSTLVNRKSPRRQEAVRFLTYLAGSDYNRLINAQADGISAFRRYAAEPGFLNDPKYPSETDNAVWLAIAERSVPDQVSPFVDGNVAGRLLQNQLDLVRQGLKSPRQAMRDAAANVNREIAKSLQADPTLAGRYQKLTGRSSP